MSNNELNKLDLIEKWRKIDSCLNFEGSNVILWHGTISEYVDIILQEGLKGGSDFGYRSRNNGDLAILCLARDYEIAERYGSVLKIKLPIMLFDKMGFYQSVNGAGEMVYALEDQRWNTVLISDEYISYPSKEHEEGICSEDEDCHFCYEETNEL